MYNTDFLFWTTKFWKKKPHIISTNFLEFVAVKCNLIVPLFIGLY